jgi:hypothetical protein
MLKDVAISRHLVGAAASLVYTGTDQDGEPVDPGTVTVAVTDFAGNTVTTGPVTGTGTGRAVAITAANNQVLDRWTAVWTVSGATVATTQHDIVGGFYATVAEIRANTVLLSDTAHTAADLLNVRSEVEYQIEEMCRRSFVPRFASEILSGSGREVQELEFPDLREVFSAEYWTGSAWAAMSVTVADIPADVDGRASLRSGVWPAGINNVRVSYAYGWDRPPADLRRAVVKAIEFRRTGDNSGIPSRSLSVQGTELGNVVLATPGLGKWITAIPEVDIVINSYKRKSIGVSR